MRTHDYEVAVHWTGDKGSGTSTYRAYGREHTVHADGRPVIEGSSDPAFRGDTSRWNPEQLLVAALAQCHMLAYLHLCAVNGVVVTGYSDLAWGRMTEEGTDGRFSEVVLKPVVTVAAPGMVERAETLHDDAHAACFIASSVNFRVRHQPSIAVAPDPV